MPPRGQVVCSPVGGCSHGTRAEWDHTLQSAPARRTLHIERSLADWHDRGPEHSSLPFGVPLRWEVCRGSWLGDLSAQRPVCLAVHRKGTSPREGLLPCTWGVSWPRHGRLTVRTAGGLEPEVSGFIRKSGLRRNPIPPVGGGGTIGGSNKPNSDLTLTQAHLSFVYKELWGVVVAGNHQNTPFRWQVITSAVAGNHQCGGR